MYQPLISNTRNHYFFTALLSILLSSTAVAQKVFDAKQLSITITPTAGEKKEHLTVILTNTGKSSLPAGGWSIYFNSKSSLTLAGSNNTIQLERKKANLFRLLPASTFKGIAPGKQSSLHLVLDDGLINKNDQPEGFYLVWDATPNAGQDITNLTIIPPAIQPVNGKIISDFAQTIYQRNAVINRNLADVPLPLFPTPLSYTAKPGVFDFNSGVTINTDPQFIKEAAFLASSLQPVSGKKPVKGASAKSINLQLKPGMSAEAYTLSIGTGSITIAATTPAGIFYGIQSLNMLLSPSAWDKPQQAITIPCAEIRDEPQFAYRGLMIDVARDFQTKEEILRMLDLAALFKLNTFHFHLTDDEGWRLEIDGLPELTSLGANRGHSLDEMNNMPAAYGSGATTGKLYGSGYYTRADFIEILQYAAARHIKVIPEIETPGHARAAIKAMDMRYRKFMQEGKRDEALQYLLRDTLDESVYSTPQAFHDNVMNVALPSVYTFYDKVATEIQKLYTEAGLVLTTIHSGGDEVPAGTWERSPACANLIKNDPSLHDVNDLWYYYIGKITSILAKKNITLSGWEEIGLRKTELDGKKIMIPNPGFVNSNMQLYVWNNTEGNEDLAYRLANAGYKVVLTPVSNFYLDMIQYKTYDEPGYYWGGITDIAHTYAFIPFDYLKNKVQDKNDQPASRAELPGVQRLTTYGKSNIIGLQGSIWSETLKGPQQLEYMLLPRLAALAERAWAPEPGWAKEADAAQMRAGYNKDWSTFVQVVGKRLLPLLDQYNGGYHYRIPPAGAIIENGAVLANTQFPGLQIRYTTDGTEPNTRSALYSNPITSKGIIKLKVFNATGRESYSTVIENK